MGEPGLFGELERQAWAGLLSVYAQLDRAIDADLRTNHGITHAEFEVLLRLYRADSGRLRIQDLAQGSILTRSGMSRMVKRLEGRGYVRREVADEDRRGAYAALTARGREFFEGLREPHVEFVRDRFLGRLSEADQRQLARIWVKVLDEPR